jgi:hypothetical protein
MARNKWRGQCDRLLFYCGAIDLSNEDVDDMLAKIADSVRPFSLDLRRGVYDDGKMYIGICNTVCFLSSLQERRNNRRGS